MEEYTQITLDQWVQWKEDIRQKLAETAGNFVYIGYRLKQIRDSGMYGGEADVFAFAEKEYGLGKSTVSRFIAINEKYSEGGNSLELKKEFQGFSSSKLAEMLTLPDSEIQLITEKTTIREIRELKSFNSQEPEEEELEAAGPEEAIKEAGSEETTREAGPEEATGAAGPERTPERAGEQLPKRTPLEKCVADYFKTRKEMRESVRECLEMDLPDYKEAAERMAPSGQASHRKGTIFLFLYDWNTGVKYKLMTEPEPVAMSWAEFLEEIRSIVEEPEPVEKEAPVATSQREKNSEKEPLENAVPVQSNQGKMDSVATSQQEEKEPENLAEEPEEKAEEAGAEEQIPGQDSILNHPEYLPEEIPGEAVWSEEPEGQQETEKEKKEETGQQEHEEWKQEEKYGRKETETRQQEQEAEKEMSIERLRWECTSYIGLIQGNLSLQDYRTAEKAARELLRCLQELIEESGE